MLILLFGLGETGVIRNKKEPAIAGFEIGAGRRHERVLRSVKEKYGENAEMSGPAWEKLLRVFLFEKLCELRRRLELRDGIEFFKR